MAPRRKNRADFEQTPLIAFIEVVKQFSRIRDEHLTLDRHDSGRSFRSRSG